MAEELPFLSRWSRRKVEAKQGRGDAAEAAPVPPVPVTSPVAADAAPPAPLAPIDSLTPESDFLPFLKPGVDEDLKRQALRALFRDPQFNVMDGLDIYIGDYSQPDPIPPQMLARLNQMNHLGIREREPEANETVGEGAADKNAGEGAPEEAGAAAPAAESAEAPAPAEPPAEPPEEGEKPRR
jgi:hypothetical protein